MKILLKPIQNVTLCIALALMSVLSGCANKDDAAWQKKRAAQYMGKVNPKTGQLYTQDEADRQAAHDEGNEVIYPAMGPLGTAMQAGNAVDAREDAARDRMYNWNLPRYTPPAAAPPSVTPPVCITPMR